MIYNLLGFTTFAGVLFGIVFMPPTTIEIEFLIPPELQEIATVSPDSVYNHTILPLPPEPLPEAPQGLIEYFSEQYEVDTKLALAIAECESQFEPKAKNPKSTAEGVYQFIDSTWEKTKADMGLPATTTKFDVVPSIEAGIYLLARDGTGHWLESSDCWSKKLDNVGKG